MTAQAGNWSTSILGTHSSSLSMPPLFASLANYVNTSLDVVKSLCLKRNEAHRNNREDNVFVGGTHLSRTQSH